VHSRGNRAPRSQPGCARGSFSGARHCQSTCSKSMLTKPLAARFDDSQSSPRKPILRATGEGARTPVTIKMDVTETENGYLVHSEMPGVKKEDIDVAIEGNLVTITAEVGISHDGFPLQPHVSRPVLALQDQRL